MKHILLISLLTFSLASNCSSSSGPMQESIQIKMVKPSQQLKNIKQTFLFIEKTQQEIQKLAEAQERLSEVISRGLPLCTTVESYLLVKQQQQALQKELDEPKVLLGNKMPLKITCRMLRFLNKKQQVLLKRQERLQVLPLDFSADYFNTMLWRKKTSKDIIDIIDEKLSKKEFEFTHTTNNGSKLVRCADEGIGVLVDECDRKWLYDKVSSEPITEKQADMLGLDHYCPAENRYYTPAQLIIRRIVSNQGRLTPTHQTTQSKRHLSKQEHKARRAELKNESN